MRKVFRNFIVGLCVISAVGMTACTDKKDDNVNKDTLVNDVKDDNVNELDTETTPNIDSSRAAQKSRPFLRQISRWKKPAEYDILI